MARHIVVIGGGPAGIEAAAAAARAGAQVTLVSDGPPGGRAGWDSLIPSKVWIATADLLGELPTVDAHGVAGLAEPSLDAATVLARIRHVAQTWSAQEGRRLADLGVKVLTGVAAFVDPTSLSVQTAEGQAPLMLTADAVIIASGSVPRFPPLMRPDGKQVLAPRFMSSLEHLPPDMLVIGGGVTGSEFVSLFSRLGVRVTWLVGPSGILPSFIHAAGQSLADALERHGVTICCGARTERIECGSDGVVAVTTDGAEYRAALAFLAIGRTPDLARLKLAAAGLSSDADGTLTVDGHGCTAVPHIYAVGDVAGEPMLANRAMAQAWIAGRHASGEPVAPYRPESVIQAVYSAPEVAQVGQIVGPPEAIKTLRVPFAVGLKAHLMDVTADWIELAYAPASRRICGGVAVGSHAADVLAPVALAIQLEATLEQVAAVFAAHPAFSELAFIAARHAGVGGD
jgi:pyruvate/2-oxoglutarate dehydrogenase complex dihydrolipoamide dehydrogenase (E3) component